MRTAVFFGDSLTSGDNNGGVSYVNYLADKRTVINLGVSGTTMGEYSIYPVDGNSLLSKIYENKALIENADEIFIEYGVNDVVAAEVGNVTEKRIVISFIKAIDAIKQINFKAPIFFLAVGNIEDYAEKHCDYLKNDYLKELSFMYDADSIAARYRRLLMAVVKRVQVWYLPSFLDYLDTDNIHPNNAGYMMLAKEIKLCLS